MKKVVLITGAGPTGVTGRTIKEYMDKDYLVYAPNSKELDLTNDNSVRAFFDSHYVDYVIHCATYRKEISKTAHMVDEELESNLRMYYALASQSERYVKMVYLGSGAEYDKSRAIVNVKEEQFGERIPKTKYGFGKYIMNQHCRNSNNVYNLRIFGTLNPYERYTKNVVCNLCAKAVLGMPLVLRQDCRFSWVDIRDVAKTIGYIFENRVSMHDYNIALEKSYLLSEIAKIVGMLCDGNDTISFQTGGLNNEYTCCTDRFRKEMNLSMTPIEKSISDIFSYISKMKDSLRFDHIDARWNK